jgi:hypothetical protein
MPELYERILAQHATLPPIPVHPFQSAAAEWARGRITSQQANAIVEAVSGEPLGTTGQTEALDLVESVTSISVPAAPGPLGGSPTTAQIAAYGRAMADHVKGLAERQRRTQEIDQVLLLMDVQVSPYDDPAAVRTRLGVPTR